MTSRRAPPREQRSFSKITAFKLVSLETKWSSSSSNYSNWSTPWGANWEWRKQMWKEKRHCQDRCPYSRGHAQFLQRSSAGSVVCVIKRMPAAIHTDVGKEVREIGLEHLLITSRESTRTR